MLSNWGETQGVKALHPRLARLSAYFRQLAANVSANPRLQLGLVLILAMLLGTGVLSLMDAREAEAKKLESARESARVLKGALGGGARQRQLEKELDVARDMVETTLWHARKPVIAQADFTDWLSSTLLDIGVRQPVISQPSYRFLDESSSADHPSALSEKGGGKKGGGACKSGSCSLVELRASLRLAYDPSTLNKVLAAIEGADRLVVIEQLAINLGEQRVEMAVRSYALMDSRGEQGSMLSEPDTPEPLADGKAAAPAGSADSSAEQKKTVEIKW